MAALRSSTISLLFVFAAIFFDDWISTPSCTFSDPVSGGPYHRDSVSVMLVADLFLRLPDAEDLADRLFRHLFASRTLRKSLEKMKPDMIVVLGDVSVGGLRMEAGKWLGVFHQFQWMLGPYIGLPVHVVLGERDVGECGELDEEIVGRIAGNLPGLDSSGCGVFEIGNVSFVSLNGIALLCENEQLRFGVERVVERESMELRSRLKEVDEDGVSSAENQWRDYGVEPGSGPVVLVHFPLHRTGGKENRGSSDERSIVGKNPDNSVQTLPLNATQYILQALKPRIVFSAHTHDFSDQTHYDGTREVTIPAMAWVPHIKPGFAIATFSQNKAVSVQYCFLAKEADVVIGYAFAFASITVMILAMNWLHF